MDQIKASIYSKITWKLSGISVQAKALFILFIAIIIWGGNWPIMKLGLNHVTPFWFSMLRFALGGATLFIFQIATGKLYYPKKKDLLLIFSIGFLQMMVFTVLGTIAMTQVDAGRSAVLAYTTTLWVIPLSLIFFRESLSKKQLLGGSLGLAGVILLFNPFTFSWGNQDLLIANGLLLLAAFCWSLCILHLQYTKSEATAYQLAPWQMLTATIPLVFISYLIEGPFTGDGSATFWQVCIYLGPLATAFCFCAVNGVSKYLSSTSISTAMLGVPVFGLLFSRLFLGEVIGFTLIIGVVLISLGVFVVIMSTKKS